MSKTSGTLTTKELRARVELANLQFEEDKPIDLRAVKMYVDLRRREGISVNFSSQIEVGVHTDNLLEMANEYNDLLDVDYDECALEEELGFLLDRWKNTNMSDEEYEKETE